MAVGNFFKVIFRQPFSRRKGINSLDFIMLVVKIYFNLATDFIFGITLVHFENFGENWKQFLNYIFTPAFVNTL